MSELSFFYSGPSKKGHQQIPTFKRASALQILLLFRLFIVLTIILLGYSPIWAQGLPPEALSAVSRDTAQSYDSLSVKVLTEDLQRQSARAYMLHKKQLDQGKILEELFSEIQEVKGFLKRGFEYGKVIDLVSQVSKWKEVAIEGVVANRDSLQSLRNLTATSILLNELLSRMVVWEINIHKYKSSLERHQYRLDSLAQDSALYQLPDDSSAALSHFQKLSALKSKLVPVSGAILSALDSIQRIELQVDMLKNSLESDITETKSLRKKQDGMINFEEVATIHHPNSPKRSLAEIIDYSDSKAELLIVFYISNHLNTILLMFLSLIGIAVYLRILSRRSRVANIYDNLQKKSFALHNPIATASLITFTIFQFLLPIPPFIITSFLWVLSSISLTVIFYQSLSGKWFKIWLLYLALLIIALFHNFLLLQSASEHIAILIMSVTGMVGGVVMIWKTDRKFPNCRLIITLAVVVTIFQTLSTIFSLFGNYNFAKGYMMHGFYAIIVSFILFWTIILVSDILKISRFFHQLAQDNKQQISFERLGQKLPNYMLLLIVVAWFILNSRNTYSYQTIFSPLSELFYRNWTIGKFDFTLQSVSIFFIVIFISGVISRVVSFLTADVNIGVGSNTSKEPGSWLLLVRIAIFTTGVLLAFVSAGIPMDRMAVIIGALGVGIGFGMQPLVNSLIGGLIIAFEKPVNVGDIVEISGQVGKMKSIGIRSSVVTTWDGADVIIPNGDLMTQHLVNWTMGNTKRRFEIPVGVAYGTDLDLTMRLLMQLMKEDHRILKDPEPFVMVTQFNNSSVDLVLKFWVSQFGIGFELKSDLMVAINRCFKEHNIIIPFPQQDVHFYPVTSPSGKENEPSN